MKGSFSEDALEQFARLAAEKQGLDFSEGEVYDFARCVRSDGSFYGTGGKCRKGTEAGAKKESPAQTSGAKAEKKNVSEAHRVARRVKKDFPDQVSVKLNKEDGSSTINVRNGSVISSNRIMEDYFRSHGQPHGYKHDKEESFTDKAGNKHTVSPIITSRGEVFGHTVKVTPASGGKKARSA